MAKAKGEKVNIVSTSVGSYQWEGKTFYRLFGCDESGNVYRYNPTRTNAGWIPLSMLVVEPNPKDSD